MTSPASFMGLPTELRLTIFEHVIGFTDGHQIHIRASRTKPPHAKDDERYTTDKQTFKQRTKDVSSLLRVSKTINTEIADVALKSHHLHLFLRHRHTSSSTVQWPSPQLIGPFGKVWYPYQGFQSKWINMESDRKRMSNLLRWIPRIHLQVMFWPETHGYLEDIERNFAHWQVVDNARHFVHALNEAVSGPCKQKTLHLGIVLVDNCPKRTHSTKWLDFREFMQVFEQLDDEVKLAVTTKYRVATRADRHQNDHEQDQLEGPRATDMAFTANALLGHYSISNYVDHLQRPHRSSHFPRIVKDRLAEWYKLRDWVRGAFVYEMHEGRARFAALRGKQAKKVTELVDGAWSAHHGGDGDGWRAAKEGLAEMWQVHSEKRALDIDAIES